MGTLKAGRSDEGKVIHYAVAALVRTDDRYLLLERRNPHRVFSAIAGHVEEGEDELSAILREVKEESGLTVKKHKLLFNYTVRGLLCPHGVDLHELALFECEVEGTLKNNDSESHSIGWYSQEQIQTLPLDPAAKHILERLGITKSPSY